MEVAFAVHKKNQNQVHQPLFLNPGVEPNDTGKQIAFNLADVDNQIATTTKDTMSWQAQLRAAVANSISEEDVVAIIQKQVEKAKAGNEAAAKFVLNQVLGANTPVTIRQTNIVTDPATAAKLARDAG